MYLLKSSRDNNKLFDTNANAGRRLVPRLQYQNEFDTNDDADDDNSIVEQFESPVPKYSRLSYLLNKIAPRRKNTIKQPTNDYDS